MAIQAPAPVSRSLDAAEIDEPKTSRLSPTMQYYLRRFGLYLITLWGSLTASFFFFRLLPGDPISGIITQLQTRGQYSTLTNSEDMVKFYRKEFGLDGSLWHQYINYFQRVLLHLTSDPRC